MDNWIILLLCGAIGGNCAGALMKKFSLGTLGNSIVGILGGGLGGQLLNVLGVATSGGGGLELGSIVSGILSGGVGGGVLLLIVGAIKNAMSKK
jgi:uncharacterized membrane protein YeaQ/YmgE (transglycosylase-associated protein family)